MVPTWEAAKPPVVLHWALAAASPFPIPLCSGFDGYSGICRILAREGISQIIFSPPLNSEVLSRATLTHPQVDDIWWKKISSVAQLCLTLCDLMDCSTPGFPVHHQLPEIPQTHVHRVGDATQPSYSLSSSSPPAFNLSQHQGLFQWVGSSHQVAKVLELQLQHQSFQWIFRTDFL